MKKAISCIMVAIIFAVSGGANILAESSKYATMVFATKSISAGFYTAAAIKNDGTVWSWGFNEKGALGNGSHENSNVAVKIDGIENAKSVDIDVYNTVVLTEDGHVYVAGDNSFGQMGESVTDSSATKIESLSNIIDVQTSCYYIEENGEVLAEPYIMALDAFGNVFAWGANKRGMLGTGSSDEFLAVPTKIDSLSSVAAISVNGARAVALKYDGTVYYWGYNGIEFYYADKNTSEFLALPEKVAGLTDIVSISAGSHVLALDKSGRVFGFGNGDYKQLCYNASTATPVEITEVSHLDIAQVYACNGYSLFSSKDGKLYGTGNNCNLFADVWYENYTYPVLISIPDGVKNISASDSLIAALTSQDEVFVWGNESTFGAFGTGEQILMSNVPLKSDIDSLKKVGEYAISHDGDNVLQIENAFLCDSGGNLMEAVSQDFQGSVSLDVVSGQPVSAMITFAVYENTDDNKILVGIKSENVTFEDFSNQNFDISISEYDSNKNYIVKLFVWDLASGFMDPYFTKNFEF